MRSSIAIVLTLVILLLLATRASDSHSKQIDKPNHIPKTQKALNRELARVCPRMKIMRRSTCKRWLLVAQCESGGQQRTITLRSLRQIDWKYNGKSGYKGGLQFSPRTWSSNVHRIKSRHLTRAQRKQRSMGRYNNAFQSPPSIQILAADVLRQRIGGSPHRTSGWPSCGARW